MKRRDADAEIWPRIAPWLISSVAASGVPFVLLLLHTFFPPVRVYLSLGGQPDFEQPLFFFCCSRMEGCCSWLEGASLTFLCRGGNRDGNLRRQSAHCSGVGTA